MSKLSRWTADDLPDLTGRTIVVTGANSGLGYETALALAARGAGLVLACRDPGRAEAAMKSISRGSSGAPPTVMALDLASLASVRAFAEEFLARHDALHALCNNAGVMAIPKRVTADGFEMQLGTNHLGHFALTGLLLERLLTTPGARVVSVSSTAHRFGAMRFHDLQWERGYSKWRAYGQSKLANLLFTFELQRRTEAAGVNLLCTACHPGYATTNLQLAGARMKGSARLESFWNGMNRLLAQSAAMGALPTLYAIASDDVKSGDYLGPDGFMQQSGYPVKVSASASARDPEAAAKLWEISRELTGVGYEALAR